MWPLWSVTNSLRTFLIKGIRNIQELHEDAFEADELAHDVLIKRALWQNEKS